MQVRIDEETFGFIEPLIEKLREADQLRTEVGDKLIKLAHRLVGPPDVVVEGASLRVVPGVGWVLEYPEQPVNQPIITPPPDVPAETTAAELYESEEFEFNALLAGEADL